MPYNNSNNDASKPLSVGQLNRQAKQLLEGHFAMIRVEGEISNFSTPSSGHWYFTLKDSSAQIRCAMFRGRNSRLRFTPESGQHLVVRAKLSLYEARGDYQLIVEHMELAGDGALAIAFEELKLRLSHEGLFDPALKKPLPTLPRHVAVVTSPTGAAIHDMLTVFKRRFPAIPVTILPVPVQGKEAAPAIARSLILANELAKQGEQHFDVIITARGGGSLEDLWAFNEEIVARAIAASELPVVSAVGHEVDISIADFVADVRAPTPSAAAELLSPDREEWLNTFEGYALLLQRAQERLLKDKQQALLLLASKLRHPGSQLQEYCQRLDELEARLINSCKQHIKTQQHRLQLLQLRLSQCSPGLNLSPLKQQLGSLIQRLQNSIEQQLHNQRQRLNSTMQLLHTVSPLATLNRGYSITFDQNGAILRDTTSIKTGDSITTKLAQGELVSTVTDTHD
jgi:exodeoxyribonuclease VII large subunit